MALAEAFGDHAPLLHEWQEVSWVSPNDHASHAARYEAFEAGRQRAIRILEAALRAIAIAAEDDGQRRKRHLVFVSYSHKDVRWLRRLHVHLRPFERDEEIRRWDDTMLHGGEGWRENIRTAIAETKVAILLISADFLASDFVHTNELPPLLAAAESEGALILPIIVSSSAFKTNAALSHFQAVNSPSKPLDCMTRAQQEKVLSEVAARVAKILAST